MKHSYEVWKAPRPLKARRRRREGMKNTMFNPRDMDTVAPWARSPNLFHDTDDIHLHAEAPEPATSQYAFFRYTPESRAGLSPINHPAFCEEFDGVEPEHGEEKPQHVPQEAEKRLAMPQRKRTAKSTTEENANHPSCFAHEE